MTTPSDLEVRFLRRFEAPRALLFDAWTRPEHVRHWWDPSGAELAVCEIDLRPGGLFRWVNRGECGPGHAFLGTYQEIVPMHRLVFAVPTDSQDSIATLLFEDVDGATCLDMTIRCSSGMERNALLDRHVDVGTAKTLENLARYLPHLAEEGPARTQFPPGPA
ncbi:MAG: SRPBCC domain-containing protein [Caldimonas sp.]